MKLAEKGKSFALFALFAFFAALRFHPQTTRYVKLCPDISFFS